MVTRIQKTTFITPQRTDNIIINIVRDIHTNFDKVQIVGEGEGANMQMLRIGFAGMQSTVSR